MSLLAQHIPADDPNRMALIDQETTLGWAELDQVMNRAINLLHSLDLGPERRLAVFAENAAETVIAYVATALAGASAVPVNFHLTPDELAYIVEDSAAALLLVGPETAERGRQAAQAASNATGRPPIPVMGWRCSADSGVISWEESLAQASDEFPPIDIPPVPHLFYTSGTTGRPKGVDAPPALFRGGATVAEYFATCATPNAAIGTHMVVGPLYHAGPFAATRNLMGGAPVVVMGRFDAEATLAAIDRHRVNGVFMVPTHFSRLLALPAEVRKRYRTDSLVSVTHSGAPCPVSVKRAIIEWLGPIVYEGYGSTEVGGSCHINSEDWLAHPGSVGRPVAPFEVLIVDKDGNELPPGQEGRVYFVDNTGRGISYRNAPEKTAAAHLRPGVFTLGEIGYTDDEGFLFLTDRFSDMVVSGGVNIYPAETEQVLVEHPGVADVACIGVPDEEMGEQLKALVVPSDFGQPPTEPEIIAFCRDRIAHYKCPRSVEFISEGQLGRSAMGKINKQALRAPYWKG
ncbi:MAG: AMP-binding protein [bacterium]|nr:AMP-binding protein [bacterium]